MCKVDPEGISIEIFGLIILLKRNVVKCSKNSENFLELKIREKNAEENFVLHQIFTFDTEILFRFNAMCWPKKIVSKYGPKSG